MRWMALPLFNRWGEWFEKFPEGSDVRDIRMARICETIANSNPYDKKRHSLRDYLLKWEKDTTAKSGDAQTTQGVASLKSALAGLHKRLLAKQSKEAIADGQGLNSNDSGLTVGADQVVQQEDSRG